MGLQINPGLSKYRVGLDDYKRMEGLIVGRRYKSDGVACDW